MKIRVTIDQETFEVEVGDLSTRPILATVDGETFEIYPEDLQPQSISTSAVTVSKPVAAAPTPVIAPPKAQPVDCAPPTSSAASSDKVLKAPIPGVIISVSVKVGDQVSQGQELCLLEAMKMKNAIRSTRSGTIAAILISNGDTVSHGQPLMEFSD